MNKRILILTAGFGEGHNSAARGVRDGLARVAPNQADVELRDLFAEAYGPVNEFVRRGYLALVNSAPRAWGIVYRWLDRKIDYDTEFRRFTRLKSHLAPLLERFRPSIVVCSFPAYANVLQEILGPKRFCKCVVVVTDSITINATWYRSPADYFLAANEQSARVLYMIHAATRGAPELVRSLAKLGVDLTVTIGHADKLRTAIEAAADGHPIEIVGWTN